MSILITYSDKYLDNKHIYDVKEYLIEKGFLKITCEKDVHYILCKNILRIQVYNYEEKK
jgi:hypothetical protein